MPVVAKGAMSAVSSVPKGTVAVTLVPMIVAMTSLVTPALLLIAAGKVNEVSALLELGWVMQIGALAHEGSAQSVNPLPSLSTPSLHCPPVSVGWSNAAKA